MRWVNIELFFNIENLVVFSEVESSDESNIPSTLNGNNHHSDELIKRTTLGRSDAKRLHRKLKKYQIGEATDDVRLCIMCLRAIMNNQVNKNIQFPMDWFSMRREFRFV
jgi:hypothetical protein